MTESSPIYQMFCDDPEAQRSSYLHDHYRRGRQGIMKPDGPSPALEAWKAGRDSATAD
jgi:hypothetical protein